MEKGFWNGEPASFTVVEYEVTKPAEKMWWNNRHAGTRRQAIQVKQGNETWLIDNQHGDGYYKVTLGMGSPRCRHKSVENPANITYVPRSKWIIRLDWVGIEAEEEGNDKWMEENYPDEFKRLLALRKTLEDHQKKYKL